jgi:hypothetical protein
LPTLPLIEIKQGAQWVLTGKTVIQRRAVVARTGGHVQPHVTKKQPAREREIAVRMEIPARRSTVPGMEKPG